MNVFALLTVASGATGWASLSQPPTVTLIETDNNHFLAQPPEFVAGSCSPSRRLARVYALLDENFSTTTFAMIRREYSFAAPREPESLGVIRATYQQQGNHK